MVPDAEAYRRREIGSKRSEEEMKKIQPLRPLGAADTDLEYPLAAKGGRIQHKWHGGPIVDTLVNTFPSLAPVANAIGATKVGLSEKELPTDDMYWYSNGATRDLIGNDRRGDVNPMLGVPLSTQPTDLPKSIKMYRADPTGKYGGKEGIETLPQPRFDVGGDRYHNKVEDPTVSDVYGDSSKAIQQLYRYARLNGAANKYGYPSLSPEDVAAMALKEGRSDLGFNAVNLGHPDELKFNKMLRDTYNLTSNDQNFLAALFAKQRVADKFNIPFANAWNGTGVNDAGQSGKDYAKNYEHHKKAALHPNNQQLMELVNRAIEDGKKHGLPLRENSIKDSMRHYIPVPYKASGGVIDMDRMRLELMNGKKKFLGESKVKERLYHGTNKNIRSFSHKLIGTQSGNRGFFGRGFYLSGDPDVANSYADTTGGNVMPLHVSLDNPLVIEDKISHKAAQALNHALETDAFKPGMQKENVKNGLSMTMVDNPDVADMMTDKLIGRGYDGVVYGNNREVVAFHPHQIKSAIGNRGTYDTTNPDITKAKGGSVKEPKNTVKAYKLFRVHPKHPGKLFPLFVNANEPVEMNKWVDAKEGEMAGDKVKSKIGPLAYRPGWHAGDLPVATHIGEKSDPNLTAPDVRPANHVWAEVEMPHDVDWQSVANERGMNPKGKLIARNAHITDQIPKGGHYRYKTNSNMTGNWLIGGAMKVNRILHDKEVKAINKAAGAADLPRAKPFKAKDYGFASGGLVAPDEWKAEEHVNYMSKGGSNIKKITPYIKEREGQYGLQRLQRASDEIPRLSDMYSEDALRRAFSGDNAKALMTMDPAEFERYAERLGRFEDEDSTRFTTSGEKLNFNDYLAHLAKIKGGFADVPFLEIGRRKPEYLPSIEGHEGRHRSRALAGKGVKKSLVQLIPTGGMREPMPRRYREDFIEAMKKELGEKRLVTPEGRSLLPADLSAQEHRNLENRNLLAANRPQLPEVYKSGGATHAHHLDIEERPL